MVGMVPSETVHWPNLSRPPADRRPRIARPSMAEPRRRALRGDATPVRYLTMTRRPRSKPQGYNRSATNSELDGAD
jgi:hypothetical protein